MYKEIRPTNALYGLVNNLLPDKNLRFYLDRYSNFDWEEIIRFDEDNIPIENSDKFESDISFWILDIENMNHDELETKIKYRGRLQYAPLPRRLIILTEITRLENLINNHLDNYNEYSYTGYVKSSDLRSLINILKEIDIKISTFFSEIETEIYPSEDETLH
jgi:hypothetical protein